MKAIRYTVSSILAIACFAFAGVAFAQGVGAGVDAGIDVNAPTPPAPVRANVKASGSANTSAGTRGDEQRSETGTRVQAERVEADETATGTESETEASQAGGSEEGLAHRSAVANVVQNLLSLAERAGGIGEEVRVVAQEQASTSVQSAEAMDTLDHESAVKVFFFGPDARSVGEIRSSLATTESGISRLTRAMDATSDASVKAELAAQIQVLEDEASSTETYLSAHEDVFSLFGWFTRLF